MNCVNSIRGDVRDLRIHYAQLMDFSQELKRLRTEGPERLALIIGGEAWPLFAAPEDRDCRVTFRNYEAPGSRNYSLGFRLAL